MYYRLFNGVNLVYNKGDTVPLLKYDKDIVVAIDPSKTNCAMIIGTLYGDILSIVEMSGNNWKRGPIEDTTLFCSELRGFITSYLQGLKVSVVGVEKAITKRGMEHHTSNMVLTEIRATLLSLFLECFNKKQIEVNNWTWKSNVLPEGYRSQNEKGSKRYFTQFSSYFEADVTDCYGIYKYLVQRYRICCIMSEKATRSHYYYISGNMQPVGITREFVYNPGFTLQENINYFVNRSNINGYAVIRKKDVTGYTGFIPEEAVLIVCLY